MLGLVAAGTDFDLAGRGLNGIFGGMEAVAACARDITRRMRTRGPVMRCIRLVAPQTIRILLQYGRVRFGTESDDLRGIALRIDMRAAGPVTRLALQPAVAERAVRISGARVLGVENSHDGRVAAVTSEAGIGSLRAVDGRGRRRARCGRVPRTRVAGRRGDERQDEGGEDRRGATRDSRRYVRGPPRRSAPLQRHARPIDTRPRCGRLSRRRWRRVHDRSSRSPWTPPDCWHFSGP